MSSYGVFLIDKEYKANMVTVDNAVTTLISAVKSWCSKVARSNLFSNELLGEMVKDLVRFENQLVKLNHVHDAFIVGGLDYISSLFDGKSFMTKTHGDSAYYDALGIRLVWGYTPKTRYSVVYVLFGETISPKYIKDEWISEMLLKQANYGFCNLQKLIAAKQLHASAKWLSIIMSY